MLGTAVLCDLLRFATCLCVIFNFVRFNLNENERNLIDVADFKYPGFYDFNNHSV